MQGILLAAGYGVLFTIVDDYRDEYGISETAIGIVIGLIATWAIGSFAGWQVLLSRPRSFACFRWGVVCRCLA